jgi:hypothetical protein
MSFYHVYSSLCGSEEIGERAVCTRDAYMWGEGERVVCGTRATFSELVGYDWKKRGQLGYTMMSAPMKAPYIPVPGMQSPANTMEEKEASEDNHKHHEDAPPIESKEISEVIPEKGETEGDERNAGLKDRENMRLRRSALRQQGMEEAQLTEGEAASLHEGQEGGGGIMCSAAMLFEPNGTELPVAYPSGNEEADNNNPTENEELPLPPPPPPFPRVPSYSEIYDQEEKEELADGVDDPFRRFRRQLTNGINEMRHLIQGGLAEQGQRQQFAAHALVMENNELRWRQAER